MARRQKKRPPVAAAAEAGSEEQAYTKGLAELRPYLTPQDFAELLVELQAKHPGSAEAVAAAAAAAAPLHVPQRARSARVGSCPCSASALLRQ